MRPPQAPRQTLPGVARNPASWRRHAIERIEAQGWRRDVTVTLCGLISVLAEEWRPSSGTTSPGHDVMAARIARHESTVTRNIARLVDLGVLALESAGTIVWEPDGSVQPLRATYVLLEPRRRRVTPADGWSLTRVPRTKGERHAAGRAMMGVAKEWLAGLSPAALAAECRRWFDAGWSPRDVLTALDHRPDGPWTFTTPPRSVRAWLRHRLSFWLTPDGVPSDSFSAVEERRRAEQLAAAARAAEERRAGERRRAEPRSEATRRALAELHATLRRRPRTSRFRTGNLGARNADPLRIPPSGGSPLSRAREARQAAPPSAGGGNGREARLRALFARHGVPADELTGIPDPHPIHSESVPELFPRGTGCLPRTSASA